MTFGEIEKELEIEISIIAKIADNLTQNLLLYTIKNRQLLSNKLDKVYGISEIYKIINIVGNKTISDKLNKIFSSLGEPNQMSKPDKLVKDEKIIDLLKFITDSGCIITLDEAKEKISPKSFNRVISTLIHEKLLHLYHSFKPDFNSYLIINEKIIPYLVSLINSDSIKRNINIHNRYFLLNNLLYAYDTISTFGLFLTKQLNFRKIDKRRISEEMLEITDIYGRDISSEKSAQLSIFILNRLKCLKLVKDIASISLSGIQKELEKPFMLVKKIIESINDPNPDSMFFKPPFEMPSFEFIKDIIKLLHRLKPTHYSYLRITMLTGSIAIKDGKSIKENLAGREKETERLISALNFLCLTGIIEVENDLIKLSDIGKQIANIILKLNLTEQSETIEKNIYINADFTLIIPVNELGSNTLYHLLTHTEITKNDFIIHAVISKSSIVRAYKRGMSLGKFMETLKLNSKNDLPQNLTFLLTEWSKQTISIKISQNILLKSSHSSFMDELLFAKIRDGIIERISENHAIVKKESIDEIIKLARKKDAIISLFDGSDDTN